MADLGYLAVILACILSGYAALTLALGYYLKRPHLFGAARAVMWAVAALATLAGISLIYLLLVGDFRVLYVAQYTNRALPWFYKVSALWAGNAGSLLLWAWVLSFYAVATAAQAKPKPEGAYAWLVLAVNAFFFFFLLTTVANPFARTAGPAPADGQGLNPLLQNPGMVFHPLTLYLGYVGAAVPYAYAMAALATKRLDTAWIKATRRWMLVAWIFLTLGNLYGAQWAYVELGWGGYWGWDPVENASFIPWLTATAYLHSVMVQERRDMLKSWNVVLIALTYLLTIFGTFLVRSGILSSVHAFSETGLGPFLLAFLMVMLVWSFFLILTRLPQLQQGRELETWFSREGGFLLTNLLLLGAAFVTFWGTIYPIVTKALRGAEVTLGPEYFNRANGPILFGMLLLMGICPLLAWRKTEAGNLAKALRFPLAVAAVVAVALAIAGPPVMARPLLSWAVAALLLAAVVQEFYRGWAARRRSTGEGAFTALWQLVANNRRRYGGFIVHIGVALIAIAVVGSYFYPVKVTATVQKGETFVVGDYTLTYRSWEARPVADRTVVAARLDVARNGRFLASIEPQKVAYEHWPEWSTEVAILGGPLRDVYAILAGWDNYGEEATFEVHVNPLVFWLWVGGYVLILGTIVAIWPGRREPLSEPPLRKERGLTKEEEAALRREIEEELKRLRT